ncbi:hypothetical protein [Ruminococcus sp.]|uniref:hypothetical protein n=1 Tax=Ruminococcus sp. TaxID=41978 RepID=UPI0025DF05FE|nr:hypothetical protein [Ruminococcus sp.]
MKKEKVVHLGDVELWKAYDLYAAYIDINGMKHMTMTTNILEGLDFIIKTKEELCTGKQTSEDLITKDDYVDISYAAASDGFFQIKAHIMDRNFVLTLSDKQDAIRILSVLEATMPHCLFDQLIIIASRRAIKMLNKHNR